MQSSWKFCQVNFLFVFTPLLKDIWVVSIFIEWIMCKCVNCNSISWKLLTGVKTVTRSTFSSCLHLLQLPPSMTKTKIQSLNNSNINNSNNTFNRPQVPTPPRPKNRRWRPSTTREREQSCSQTLFTRLVYTRFILITQWMGNHALRSCSQGRCTPASYW